MKRKPALFAVALTASLFTSTLQPAQAQFLGPIGSGYMGAQGYQYGDMMSATRSVMLQGMQQQAFNDIFMRSAMLRSEASYGGRRYRSRPTAAQLQARRGQKLIKAGRATVKFPMRAWPSNFWMANTLVDKSVSASQDRRTRSSGIALQRQEFARQVAQRGANWGDMADMMTVATMIAIEAHTGQKVGNQNFRTQSTMWRRYWLKNAMFQGRSKASKQEFYEGQILLGGTYAWWLRNVKGDTAKAKTQAAKFFDEWYKGGTTAILNEYRPYLSGSTRLARTADRATPMRIAIRTVTPPDAQAAPAAQAAPPMSLAQAQRVTRFQTSPNSLVLDALVKGEVPEKRAQTRRLYAAMLDGSRAELRQNLNLSPQAPDDVAQAMTWMIANLYVSGVAPLDKPNTTEVTDAQLDGLYRQIATMLASDPKFRANPAQAKQVMYESSLLIPAMLIVAGHQARKSGDVQAQNQVREAARASLQQLLGVSIDKLRFTNAGLRF